MYTINVHMVQVVLVWTTAALISATTILTIQNADLTKQLNDLINKIGDYESYIDNSRYATRAYEYGRSSEAVVNNNSKVIAEINYRLPAFVLPQHYQLYLHPDLSSGTFSGQTAITLKVVEATKQIILHAAKLNITSIYVQSVVGWIVGQSLTVDNFKLDELREFLIINMLDIIPNGVTLTLGILFDGQMSNKIVGLYSSTYLNPQQAIKTIAASKLEPTYARQMFPCFDEPALKATFNITVVHPTGSYHALSNMPQVSSVYQGYHTEAIFATTVPISTYLICILVTDFDFKTQTVNAQGIGRNFNVRIFTTAHQLNKVDFVLTTAVAVTEYYIQYYKVAYPLPKLDLAAIPDFVSNAMENWGLLTYREAALLYDANYSSAWNKQSIAATVAHELAHMWFGNLVTLKWWNDLWLNEGFARYMQYKGVHAAYPDWDMPNQFLVHTLHSVLEFDAKVSSHAIVQNVESPDQITEQFDTINYEKGAAIVRMLEDVVGFEKFENAVTAYLQKFKYNNAVTTDFLNEIEATGLNFDVKLMMRTWTEQMGYPVVHVKRNTANSFTLKQKRFLANIADYEQHYNDTEFNYTWTIPLTYFTHANTKQINRIFFAYNDDQLTITLPNATKWLKFNAHQVGYYRVNYESSIWSDIIDDLKDQPTDFGIADRAQLLNDAFALADASQLAYSIPLDMTAYLINEYDFVPWQVAATKLLELSKRLMYTKVYVRYLDYARHLLTHIYDTVTWHVVVDNHLLNRLRATVLNAACSLGLPDCLNHVQLLFNAWLEQPVNKPAPDLRELVYYYGMQQMHNESNWLRMLQIYQNERDASEKLKLMYALSAVRKPHLLYRFVLIAENETYVRRQDYFTCLKNIATNPIGATIVWDYVRENWPKLVNRFGLNDRSLERMLPAITSGFASEIKVAEMQEFFAKYSEAGAGATSRKQALETVRFNVRWLAENENEIMNWLERD